MEIMLLFLALMAAIACVVFIVLLRKKSKAHRDLSNQHAKLHERLKGTVDLYEELRDRFKGIVDLEEEKEKIKNETANMEKSFYQKADQFRTQEEQLINDYREKRTKYEDLLKEVNILEETLEMISFGMYKPHFDFDTSDRYKQTIQVIRDKQKEIIRDKKAATCETEWEVAGSKVEGRKMINRNIKLIIRAFNGDCDAAIMKARWNNIQKMEERIKKSFDALNILGEPIHIRIDDRYLQLKLDELHLAYEYQEKKQQEKEEQREIREQMREEEKVRKEIEKAKKDSEKEEQMFQALLEKAREEIGKADGKKLEEMQEKMRNLEEKLKEAHEKKERALAQAQLTKAGHVYVISNIGSFGEHVYKIGMTRRLEPLDRVRELGDASVPFAFDVHAMLYSENAPELERTLQNTFNERRLNLVNNRKEFFHISLDEIESAAKYHCADIEFTKIAEAREYRESLSIRDKQRLEMEEKQQLEQKFPDTLKRLF